ncbi:hypothetical protein [Streptomyces buecherae]|uniref:hypothetical protein n=1 Tax=Streptomyces buecherae TaxID=2763006 RepID=UPI00367BE8B7
MDNVPKRHALGGTRASIELAPPTAPAAHPLVESVGATLTYTAFCHDHWPVYQRFSSAIAGSPHRGNELARTALCAVAAHWPAVLGSASPSATAWDLLSQQCTLVQAEPASRVHAMLDRLEADALVLRHKIGLTSQQAGHAMGLSEADFELLHNRALRNLNCY